MKFIQRFGLVAFAFVMVAGLFTFTSMENGQADTDSFSGLKKQVQRIVEEADTDGTIGVFIDTGEGIINMNEKEVMSSASVIKVPILAEAIRQAERGDLAAHLAGRRGRGAARPPAARLRGLHGAGTARGARCAAAGAAGPAHRDPVTRRRHRGGDRCDLRQGARPDATAPRRRC